MSRYIDLDKLLERWNIMSVRGRTEFDQETNLMQWEEFVKEKRTIPTNAEPTVIACPECGKRIYRRTGIVLASYPPVQQYFCECGWTGYV